ncbi:hypothetical protein [Flavobacterium sp. SM2513]|uniref:hypothetical protein n=1 Tax=Flavobacterium sp. SM2513 TaxID=3424766 RepID=UPI003D7FF67A
MKLSFSTFLLIISVFNTINSFSQVKGEKNDTIQKKIVKNDSTYVKQEKDTTLYNKIEKFSEKSKFTKLLHKAIFESRDVKSGNPIKRPRVRNYKKYEGKIVRNIIVETLDPFGYSVNDTTKRPKNWAEETGNRLHLKSKEFAIRNLSLIKRKQPLDTLIVRETERLIRSQRFVREVNITANLIQPKSDSIDVTIRVLDSWSLIPSGSISPSRTNFELVDRNAFGTGIEFTNRITTEKGNENTGFQTELIAPTIKNSYIRTSLNYRINLDGSYGKSINIERRFYSAYTKWAGGIYMDQQFNIDSLQNSAGDYALQNFKYNSQDLWAGHALAVFNGTTETARTTNLILATRFLHTGYNETPSIAYDSINYYSGENFVMMGIGISSRRFVEDQYLFNYGIIEDVPIGKIYNITGGYQRKNNQGRYYLGGRASFGNYFKFGYLSANLEYGTFFNDKRLEQSALNLQVNYFTDLIMIGDKWKMRQFVKPQVVLGWNRLESNGDYISIDESTRFQGDYGAGFDGNNSFGIRGYATRDFGTKKVILSLQTQFYSPWDLWGFRVNPYFNLTTGILGNNTRGIFKSPVYSSFVVGVIISNDYLVFNSFQFSLAYFPSIPGQGSNLFKTNSFETEDFGFQDFELGKPRTVLYQ